MTSTTLPRDVALLAGIFTASGVLHLVRPRTFKPLMPRWVPAHREVIIGSGIAELACAAGLLHPATRGPAGLASAVLLVGVFPGNVKMALDASRSASTAYQVATLARLPLQWPLIRIALRAREQA
jgi:uncharacterized membrane protein